MGQGDESGSLRPCLNPLFPTRLEGKRGLVTGGSWSMAWNWPVSVRTWRSATAISMVTSAPARTNLRKRVRGIADYSPLPTLVARRRDSLPFCQVRSKKKMSFKSKKKRKPQAGSWRLRMMCHCTSDSGAIAQWRGLGKVRSLLYCAAGIGYCP